MANRQAARSIGASRLSFPILRAAPPEGCGILHASQAFRPTDHFPMSRIAEFWDDVVVPALVEYVAIPAKSPHFDHAWRKNGHIDAAVELAAAWCRQNAVAGMKLEIARIEGRTPVLFVEVEGKSKGNVL